MILRSYFLLQEIKTQNYGGEYMLQIMDILVGQLSKKKNPLILQRRIKGFQIQNKDNYLCKSPVPSGFLLTLTTL